MIAGVAFALLSLVFAGVLDVVFKGYSRRERSRGMYLLLAGAVWVILQSGTVLSHGIDVPLSVHAVVFACGAGLLIGSANILFIESLTHINVSLAATIYRLNTIGVVILAVLFLHEPITLIKSLGIGLGVVAVLALYEGGFSSAPSSPIAAYFALAIIASLLRATWGIVLKAGSLNEVDPHLMMLSSGLGLMMVGALYAMAWERRFRVTWTKLGYGALTGGLIFLVANTLMLAIERDEASVVVPIANMSFLMSVALSAGLGMEALTRKKLFGIACAGVAIAVLARA